MIKLATSLQPALVQRPSLEVREERFRDEARTDLNNPLIVAAYSYAFFPELVANFVTEHADEVRPRLTVAPLNGEIALVGASGEFYCQHANRLRERPRGKDTPLFPHLATSPTSCAQRLSESAWDLTFAGNQVASTWINPNNRTWIRVVLLSQERRYPAFTGHERWNRGAVALAEGVRQVV